MSGSDRFWQRVGWHRAPGSSIWQMLIPGRFDIGVASMIEGLRAGVACAVPVLVGEALGYPDLSWAAIAAFWVCLTDPGGPIRVRFAALATFAILGALSCGVAIWATASNLWLAVFLAFICALAGGLARIYGEAAAKVGQFVLVTFLVSTGNFDGRAFDPRVAALLYLAGAFWALFLTLILWRIHPYGPSRRALAAVYVELGQFAAGLAELLTATTTEGDPWGQLARNRRRRTREALDIARTTVADIGRTRPGLSRRVDQQLTLLHCADQIFAALIALSDLLETGEGHLDEPAMRASMGHRIDRIPQLLDAVSAAVLAGDRSIPSPHSVKLREVDALASRTGARVETAAEERLPIRPVLDHLLKTVFVSISSAARAATDVSPSVGLNAPSEPIPVKQSAIRHALLAPLLQNLNADSVPLQHALRLAVAASIALLITFWLKLGHGYWLTMTTVLILQPYAATTWQLSLKRIVFSVLGGILAAALGLVFHTPLSIALVIFPITIATMVLRAVDYGLYVLFLTPQFVLISALTEPGGGDLGLSWLRAVNSVLGGFLALAAGTLLWPGRELQRLPAELADAISANRNYLLQVLDAEDLDGRSGAVDAARRIAGLASNNAEASVERLQSEPGNDPVTLEAAMTVVSGLRRLTGATTVVWLMPSKGAGWQGKPEFRALVAWIGDALRVMANAARSSVGPAVLEERPESPQAASAEDHDSGFVLAAALARMCIQIENIHTALDHLAAPRSMRQSIPLGAE
jgi:uncharacterized membrane protein YccC